ncbi:MAG TPA: threonine synthase [Smithellaceae bacterium]|nr:threonine synthase [Smithellaceae bacterium]HOU55766.1 threonine synthase [Smithellaceae bacterium]HQH00788.1 threonine synthase [Smithellaceae bacterium]HQH04295.1 threonine synthase [Smithellaceae bacterium]
MKGIPGMPIRYYSTNRHVKPAAGITPFTGSVSFREALLAGQSPDEGLFVPDAIPQLPMKDIVALRNQPYWQAALLVARAFLSEEFSLEVLETIVKDAYNFPVPLEAVYPRAFILRLDQGPTASFKDFAARMMARLMSHCRPEGERLNILVATSGDTGSAVGEAYKGVDGIDVTILYPADEVSLMQKKQLDTIGGNVRAICVRGKFDDCQNLVKEAFADKDLARFNLSSANSINFGRILPQIVYYIYAYAQLAGAGEEAVVSVPSGNFGNALGCEYARRMGLPVAKLIMPTNENDEFPAFLETGTYAKVSPSRACISNAMNVGHPSNLARFFELYGGTVDRTGMVHRYPDLDEMRRRIFSVSVSDGETRQTIKSVYERYRVVLEQHGAVGWAGLTAYRKKTGDTRLAICLETAHPAKFPDEIKDLLGIDPEPPESMKDLARREGSAINLSGDFASFKTYLQAHLKIKK